MPLRSRVDAAGESSFCICRLTGAFHVMRLTKAAGAGQDRPYERIKMTFSVDREVRPTFRFRVGTAVFAAGLSRQRAVRAGRRRTEFIDAKPFAASYRGVLPRKAFAQAVWLEEGSIWSPALFSAAAAAGEPYHHPSQ